MADDDVAGAEAVDDYAVDEFIGRQGGKRGIEGQHDREVEAELLEDRQLLRAAASGESAAPRDERIHADAARTRGAGGAPSRGRWRSGAQQRLVAAMHAVEVADGEHGTARPTGTSS